MKIIETGCAKYIAVQYNSGYTSDKDKATEFKSVAEFRHHYEDDNRYRYVIMKGTIENADNP